MSRSKLFGISLLAIVAICPQFPMVAQPPGGGGGGGPCTNYGCVSNIIRMAPIRWAGNGTTESYCMQFTIKNQARKVRNRGMRQGGYPKRVAGRTPTSVLPFKSCADCTPPNGNQNVIAIFGNPQEDMSNATFFEGSFGKYVCKF